jgi:predicted DNA-binding transcriptional regulator AlpA
MVQNQATPRKRGRPRKAAAPAAQPSLLCRLFNRAELGAVINCSRQKVYDLEQNDPDFPAPIYIGTTPLWLETEVAVYIQRKADARPRSVRERAAQTEAVA